MNERVRREVRELVDDFGPPSPGLASRAVAGLPDRRHRGALRRAVAAGAVLAMATGVLFWAARHTVLPARSAPAAPAAGAVLAQLERRPLGSVPGLGPACQVFGHTAAQTATYVTGPAPMSWDMTVQIVSKPDTSSTVGIDAGSHVSGPVLIRGHRLDGPGTMSFAKAPASPAQQELVLDAGSQRHWDVRMQASTAGCWAIQFDGVDFTEQAVIVLYPPVSGGLPGGQPTPQTMQPSQVRPAVRAAVTGAVPILLPSAVGADWRAEVTTDADRFSVRYSDEAGRSVLVGIEVANPPPAATQAYPAFHGDERSVYEVSGDTRILLWHQPGAHNQVDPSYPGTPYELVTTGLSDAEFWQIAHSLG